MCYFLYASLYGDIPASDYQSVQKRYPYKISPGTKHDLKLTVAAAEDCVQSDFRCTDWVCDCDSPVGQHDPDDPMIRSLGALISELAALPGAKQIHLCKTWAGRRNKREIRLKLSDTDLPEFLADLQENCLYSLDLQA